jgi:WD40 repeat protein
VISLSNDDTVKIWDLTGGEMLHTITIGDQSGWQRNIELFPNGKHFTFLTNENGVKIWDVENGEPIVSLSGEVQISNPLSITPDGAQVITSSTNHSIVVFNARDGKQEYVLEGHTQRITNLAVTSDGDRLISTSEDNKIKVWNLKRKTLLHTFLGHTENISALALTPDDKYLISGSDDKSIRVWNIATGSIVHTLEGHVGSIKTVGVINKGQTIVSASDGGTIRVWGLKTGKLLNKFKSPPVGYSAISKSSQGANLIFGIGPELSELPIRIWDLTSGEEVTPLPGHSIVGFISQIVVSPDGHFAISTAEHIHGTNIKLWSLEDMKLRHIFQGHEQEVQNIMFTPDGNKIITSSKDNSLRVWSVKTGNEVACFTGEGSISSFDIMPDSQNIVAGDAGGNVHFLKLENVKSGHPITTAHKDAAEALSVHCPLCASSFHIQDSDLGSFITCPECGEEIKLNPFTIDISD